MKKIIGKMWFVFIAIFVVLLYVLTIKGNPGNFQIPKYFNAGSPFESSHERATIAETVSLVTTGKFDISRMLADFASPDVGYQNGKFFSLFPPGVSISIIPLYLLGQQFGYSQLMSFATIPIFALFSLIFLYLISRDIFKLPRSIAIFTCLIFGFGTFAWSYSVTIYQHIPTVFLILLSIYSAFLARINKKSGLFWASISWAAIGVSVFFDYPNIFLMLPIGVYLITGILKIHEENEKWKITINTGIIVGSVFFLTVIVAHILFLHSLYSNWFQTTNVTHRYNVNNPASLTTTGNTNLDNVFSIKKLTVGLPLFLFSSEKSIFVFSPIFILAFIGFFNLKNIKQKEKWLLIIIPIINLFVYASFGDPWGGWAFGPRYLIPATPFLSLLIGIWLNSINKKDCKKMIALMLFSISSAISLAGALTTNLIPPKVEADYLHTDYGLPVTLKALVSGKSSSFIYNNILQGKVSLVIYFIVIYILLNILAFLILFVLPLLTEEKEKNI